MKIALYHFQIQVPLGTRETLERIRTLARERPDFRQSFRESLGWRPGNTPPFVGQVSDTGFTLYRDIRYRNSFLPRIRGRIESCPEGSRIDVTMNLHPFVAVFVFVWLWISGSITATLLSQGTASDALSPAGMCGFLVLLTLAGFYPEAIKARRILEEKLGNTLP